MGGEGLMLPSTPAWQGVRCGENMACLGFTSAPVHTGRTGSARMYYAHLTLQTLLAQGGLVLSFRYQRLDPSVPVRTGWTEDSGSKNRSLCFSPCYTGRTTQEAPAHAGQTNKALRAQDGPDFIPCAYRADAPRFSATTSHCLHPLRRQGRPGSGRKQPRHHPSSPAHTGQTDNVPA